MEEQELRHGWNLRGRLQLEVAAACM